MRNMLLVAVIGTAMLAACTKTETAPDPVRAVRTMTVAVQSAGGTFEFAGEVRSRTESRLGFRVGGKIVRRNAELGSTVKAGQVLAQLDAQDLRLGRDSARAALVAAQANHDLAQADFQRFKELLDKGFISSAELERRDTTLKAAQAQLEQAQAQLRSQGNQAGYANLVADVAGIVTAVEAEPGQVVTAGAPVVRIAQDGPRDVVFSVPEDKVADLKTGSAVSVRVWSENETLSGTVREVAASADPVTRTFPVKVALPADVAPPLGATVYATPKALSHAGTQVIKLPTSALRQDGKTTAVWVLDKASMTVKSQPIQIATADGNQAVVASGLAPGMLVVSAGVHVLSPGQKVTIYQSKVPEVPASGSLDAIKSVANGVSATATATAATAATK